MILQIVKDRRWNMEALFNGNIVFIFFFSMIAIFNYSELKEFQRIAIMYITIYALVATNIVNSRLGILLLFITMFCFLEILTDDDTKFKILVNPIYKIVDCLYLSFFQYSVLEVILAIVLLEKCFDVFWKDLPYACKVGYNFLSFVMFVLAVTRTLQQRYVINTFKEMYRVFADYPINKVIFDEKLNQACEILVSIEDRTYFERKSYTFLSIDALKCILKRKFLYENYMEKIKYTYYAGSKFARNVIKEDRGYSTIPMQLIRSMGIKRGYNYKYRRKIFEFLYSRMFFEGIKKMFQEDQVAKREHVKEYLLYIYFHKVNTFLGDATFSKFLNAFDMKYSKKNEKDIYDISNEGIFIACMGLSKRVSNINKDNVSYYIGVVENVKLDQNVICEMVSKMMQKPYDGNYLQ